jgi:hypothetical protein
MGTDLILIAVAVAVGCVLSAGLGFFFAGTRRDR